MQNQRKERLFVASSRRPGAFLPGEQTAQSSALLLDPTQRRPTARPASAARGRSIRETEFEMCGLKHLTRKRVFSAKHRNSNVADLRRKQLAHHSRATLHSIGSKHQGFRTQPDSAGELEASGISIQVFDATRVQLTTNRDILDQLGV